MAERILFSFGLICCVNAITMISTDISFIQCIQVLRLLSHNIPHFFFLFRFLLLLLFVVVIVVVVLGSLHIHLMRDRRTEKQKQKDRQSETGRETEICRQKDTERKPQRLTLLLYAFTGCRSLKTNQQTKNYLRSEHR